jgi:hypothetical protein
VVLPALGRPTRATKPLRCGDCSGVLTRPVSHRPPTPLPNPDFRYRWSLLRGSAARRVGAARAGGAADAARGTRPRAAHQPGALVRRLQPAPGKAHDRLRRTPRSAGVVAHARRVELAVAVGPLPGRGAVDLAPLGSAGDRPTVVDGAAAKAKRWAGPASPDVDQHAPVHSRQGLPKPDCHQLPEPRAFPDVALSARKSPTLSCRAW